jgi:hypothetical protein
MLCEALAHLPVDQPGLRLREIVFLSQALASQGRLGALAAGHLGPTCRPVRAILFDKTERTNWALGWHQDRTICVAERCDVEGFGHWSIKQGLQHVEPPFALLAGMLTMRIHLDDVPESNGPLLIAPGSHRLGNCGKARFWALLRAAATLSALRSPEMSGFIQRRSSMLHRLRRLHLAAGCCRSTFRRVVCREVLPGLVSSGSCSLDRGRVVA